MLVLAVFNNDDLVTMTILYGQIMPPIHDTPNVRTIQFLLPPSSRH